MVDEKQVLDGFFSGICCSMLVFGEAAHGLGIASCWIHRAKEEFERPEGRAILEGLGIDPDAYEGIGHCILGYADGPEPAAKPRKEGYVYRIA